MRLNFAITEMMLFNSLEIFKSSIESPKDQTQVFSLPPDVVGRGEDFFVLNVTFV